MQRTCCGITVLKFGTDAEISPLTIIITRREFCSTALMLRLSCSCLLIRVLIILLLGISWEEGSMTFSKPEKLQMTYQRCYHMPEMVLCRFLRCSKPPKSMNNQLRNTKLILKTTKMHKAQANPRKAKHLLMLKPLRLQCDF